MRGCYLYVAAFAMCSSLGLRAQGGTLELASVSFNGGLSTGDSQGYAPDISDDGRFVVFTSDSTDLVPNNDTNSSPDVFLRDLWQQTTVCVSADASGKPLGGDHPSISGDGHYVFFRQRCRRIRTASPESPQSADLRLGSPDAQVRTHQPEYRRERWRYTQQPTRAIQRWNGRRLPVPCYQSGEKRCQRSRGRLRARPQQRDHDSCIAGLQRHRWHQLFLWSVHFPGWRLGRFRQLV